MPFLIAEAPKSLIAPSDYWTLMGLMAVGTAFALWLETRYKWADRLSAPVVGMIIAMLLSNSHLVPTDSPAYDFIPIYLVPLALPLMLFRANLVRIIRATGRLFAAVHLSTLGTVIGAFAAVALLRGHVTEIEKAAAVMTGSYVGGMVNFNAITDSTKASSALTNPLIVADNLIMAGVFVLLVWMAASRWFLSRYRHPHTADDGSGLPVPEEAETAGQKQPPTLIGLASALGVAIGVVAVAMLIKAGNEMWIPPREDAGALYFLANTLFTNRFVLITAVSLAVATLFHKQLTPLYAYEDVGRYLLYLFLFSIGMPADLWTVLSNAPMLFVFCAIMCVGNIGVTLLLGKFFKISLEDCLIAINATIGGPPTAAAMAVSRGWPKLVLPGLLAGLWGYVIGTPVGMMVYAILTAK